MALASTDPRVLMGQAKCFACLTPHQQYILRTYLLALIAMGDTSITGVQALSAASTCFACLTYEELLAAKQYLMAVWLGLDTSKAGIIAQVAAAACDFACLTPKQAEQLRTYLLAVTAGVSTTAAGVRTLEAAAKCFNCLESKQQLEAQVYLLSTLAPGAPTTPAAIMQGAKCYLSCVPPQLHEALQTSLFAQVTSRSTPPCVTPTAPSQPTVVTATTNLIKIAWTQPANSGSLIQSYTISWGTATGVYTNSATVGAGVRNYTITGLSVGTPYFFVVRGNSFSGCSSANSTEQTATTAGSSIDPAVTDWANRVVLNGGAAVSNSTMTAVDTFYKGLKADGLDTLMIAVNIIAPDNLIAAQTPLIKVKGNDPWTNGGPFVAGDLSVSGLLAGGGSGKYLESGVNPTTAYSSDNDAGYTWYAGAPGLNNNAIAWAFNGGSSDALYSNGANYNCGCHNTWDMTPALVGTGLQFGSVNRTGAAAADFYLANSVLGFTHPGTSAGAPAVRVNLTIPFGLRNFNGVYGLAPANAVTYSFMAVHHGLTSAQAQALFNRVQTLRTAFGGGFQ